MALPMTSTLWYIRLKVEARRIGLVINATKIKYMRGRGSREDNVNLPPRVQIGGDEIEAVDEFVYLGSLVTADNDTSREIQRRIMAGNRAYFGLRRTLRSNRIRRRTKLTIYKNKRSAPTESIFHSMDKP